MRHAFHLVRGRDFGHVTRMRSVHVRASETERFARSLSLTADVATGCSIIIVISISIIIIIIIIIITTITITIIRYKCNGAHGHP